MKKKNYKKFYSFLKNNCKKNVDELYTIGWYIVFKGRLLKRCETKEEADLELDKFNKEIDEVYSSENNNEHCWVVHIDKWMF